MGLLLLSSLETAAAPVAPPPLPFVASTPYGVQVAAMDRDLLRFFGQPVIYAPEDGEAVSIVGIFGQVFELVRGDVPMGVEALDPAVFLRLEDVPADPETDDPTLTIGGADYVVTSRIPDGIGGIVLVLRRG